MRRFAALLVVFLLIGGSQTLLAQDQLTVGVPLEDMLRWQPKYYTFTLDAPALVSISLNSEDFDAFVTLNDANGRFIAEDDDSGPSLDSVLVTMLSEAGEYIVEVDSAFGDDSGDFVLTVSVIDPPVLEYEVATDVELRGMEPAYVTFTGGAGHVVNILSNSDIDDSSIVLELLSPSGELIRDTDISFDIESAIMRFVLPEKGSYIVKVSPAYGEAFGIVYITVEQTEVLSLDHGPVTVDIRGDYDFDVVRLSTIYRELYTLSMEGSGVPFSVDIGIGDYFDGYRATFTNVMDGSFSFVGTGEVVEIVISRSLFGDGALLNLSVMSGEGI